MRKHKPTKPDPFIESAKGSLFNGVRLEPWTKARQVAAQTLGMTYPNLSKSDWVTVKRGGAYPGAVRDVMLAYWLRTIPDEELIKVEIAGMEIAMKESMEFGIKHGINDPLLSGFWTALESCLAMWHDVGKAITIPDPKRAKPDDDEGND